MHQSDAMSVIVSVCVPHMQRASVCASVGHSQLLKHENPASKPGGKASRQYLRNDFSDDQSTVICTQTTANGQQQCTCICSSNAYHIRVRNDIISLAANTPSMKNIADHS